MTTAGELQRGRDAFATRRWAAAFAALSNADRQAALEPEDLERLATAAFLVGQDSAHAEALTRSHHEFLNRGHTDRAARAAFWLVFGLMFKGQQAQASGWLARATRLLDESGRDCVERGYLLLAHALRHVTEGHPRDAGAVFADAASIGARFGDIDLVTLGRQGCGRALINQGEIQQGIALLDEVMVAVTAGEVSPPVVGIVYCSVIEGCYEMYDLRRAHEWTAALTAWCAAQPELVAYRGHCLVRRAEILQMHGAWPDAIEEAKRACEALSQPSAHPSRGAAFYQRAELHRLRGEFEEAEAAYRLASQSMRRPAPGLALLRLAQGSVDAAAAAIRRLLEEARDRRTRPRVLAAAVEIELAAGDVAAARRAADELRAIADEVASPFLQAVAGQALGAVLLADARPREALDALRSACTGWEELEASYEIARVRALMGRACAALGDMDGARTDWSAALGEFERLGAAPDVARVEGFESRHAAAPAGNGTGGLTDREVEVLKLVATGMTNRAIAEELAISEKTVARHISNIFTKLDLSSRSAATAYAYERGLMPRT